MPAHKPKLTQRVWLVYPKWTDFFSTLQKTLLLFVSFRNRLRQMRTLQIDWGQKAQALTKCIKHGWGAVQICSFSFLISFGHVGQDAAS
jgi:hypothetical protein